VSRRVKPRILLPLINRSAHVRQRGAALIAAIFVITALATLGALMTQFLVLGSEESIDEWYSSQALYAAESGIEWSIYGGGVTASNQVVDSGSVWFDVKVTTVNFGGGKTLHIITGVGKAGGTAASPRVQRKIVVQYMP